MDEVDTTILLTPEKRAMEADDVSILYAPKRRCGKAWSGHETESAETASDSSPYVSPKRGKSYTVLMQTLESAVEKIKESESLNASPTNSRDDSDESSCAYNSDTSSESDMFLHAPSETFSKVHRKVTEIPTEHCQFDVTRTVDVCRRMKNLYKINASDLRINYGAFLTSITTSENTLIHVLRDSIGIRNVLFNVKDIDPYLFFAIVHLYGFKIINGIEGSYDRRSGFVSYFAQKTSTVCLDTKILSKDEDDLVAKILKMNITVEENGDIAVVYRILKKNTGAKKFPFFFVLYDNITNVKHEQTFCLVDYGNGNTIYEGVRVVDTIKHGFGCSNCAHYDPCFFEHKKLVVYEYI